VGEAPSTQVTRELAQLVREAKLAFADREHEKAEMGFRQAVALVEKTWGSEAREIVEPLRWLAMSAARGALGPHPRLEECLELHTRALRVFEASFPRKDPRIVSLLHDVALDLWALDRRGEALPYLQRAVAAHDDAHGESEPSKAPLLGILADLYGELEMARDRDATRRRQVRVADTGPACASPDLLHALLALAYDRLDSAEREHAIPPLERALLIAESTGLVEEAEDARARLAEARQE
jgi:tetratricopeptide (TPR) repeat protein